jgi:hypothetical protein
MKCRRIRDTSPLTPYIVDGIAARTMTWLRPLQALGHRRVPH